MSGQLQLGFNNYKQGLYIAVWGKKADAFYILQQGKVRLIGEIEGEGGQALTDVMLITLQQRQYLALIQKNPQIVLRIIIQFSKRLRELNQTLVQNSIMKSASKDTSEESFLSYSMWRNIIMGSSSLINLIMRIRRVLNRKIKKEIAKQIDFYRKMDKRKKNQEESRK